MEKGQVSVRSSGDIMRLVLAKGQKNMEVTYYDSPHYFYHYQTKEVIRSIEEFIQETTD